MRKSQTLILENTEYLFEEAKPIFNDPFAITIPDPDLKDYYPDDESVNRALRSLVKNSN